MVGRAGIEPATRLSIPAYQFRNSEDTMLISIKNLQFLRWPVNCRQQEEILPIIIDDIYRTPSIHRPVQRPVLYGLRDVVWSYRGVAFEVRNGPRHLEYTGVGARRKPEPLDGHLKEPLALNVYLAELLYVPRGHLAV